MAMDDDADAACTHGRSADGFSSLAGLAQVMVASSKKGMEKVEMLEACVRRRAARSAHSVRATRVRGVT
jgi:hypothetical protein